MYLVSYDKDSGKVRGYYPLELKVDYEEAGGIQEPNLEITDKQYTEAFEAGKIAKVIDGAFVIEDIPEPTLEEKQEQWQTFLKSQYDSERVRLGTLLLMADDDEEEAAIRAQKIALKEKYDVDLVKVEQGINPLE